VHWVGRRHCLIASDNAVDSKNLLDNTNTRNGECSQLASAPERSDVWYKMLGLIATLATEIEQKTKKNEDDKHLQLCARRCSVRCSISDTFYS